MGSISLDGGARAAVVGAPKRQDLPAAAVVEQDIVRYRKICLYEDVYVSPPPFLSCFQSKNSKRNKIRRIFGENGRSAGHFFFKSRASSSSNELSSSYDTARRIISCHPQHRHRHSLNHFTHRLPHILAWLARASPSSVAIRGLHYTYR